MILAHETAKAICAKCIRVAEQASEMVPKGAVSCPGCGSYDGVKVQYTHSTVRWVFSGINSEGEVAYRAVQAVGNWNTHATPKKGKCIRCDAIIPLYILEMSPYIVPRR